MGSGASQPKAKLAHANSLGDFLAEGDALSGANKALRSAKCKAQAKLRVQQTCNCRYHASLRKAGLAKPKALVEVPKSDMDYQKIPEVRAIFERRRLFCRIYIRWKTSLSKVCFSRWYSYTIQSVQERREKEECALLQQGQSLADASSLSPGMAQSVPLSPRRSGARSLLKMQKSIRLTSVYSKDILSKLQSVPLLSAMPAHTLLQLANLFHLETWDKDQILFSEGDAGSKFYLILSGLVSIAVGKPPDYRALAQRGAGECFGEVSLLENSPRMASAIVTKPSLFIVLGRSAFEEFVMVGPPHPASPCPAPSHHTLTCRTTAAAPCHTLLRPASPDSASVCLPILPCQPCWDAAGQRKEGLAQGPECMVF